MAILAAGAFLLDPLHSIMDKDYYKTLEINRDATLADIKHAYRRLALRFHPSNIGEIGTEKFTKLGEAYDVLSDHRKRVTYDKFGEEGLKGRLPIDLGSSGAWSSLYTYHGNPDRTFSQFFGRNHPFAEVKTQVSHKERDLNLSLDELFHGCTKNMKISCRVMNEDGQTSSIEEKILTIYVKPGWREGTRITFPKEGDQGPDIIPADIVFIVRQKSHPLFVRQLDDLIYKVQISLEMALTGFSVDVETLDGRRLSIAINDIVHPLYRKVVTGEGMPMPQDSSRRGNLIITFDIQFPEKLSPETKRQIKQVLTFKK